MSERNQLFSSTEKPRGRAIATMQDVIEFKA
jgi:hypothetical protein